jgi:hypothetical protein
MNKYNYTPQQQANLPPPPPPCTATFKLHLQTHQNRNSLCNFKRNPKTIETLSQHGEMKRALSCSGFETIELHPCLSSLHSCCPLMADVSVWSDPASNKSILDLLNDTFCWLLKNYWWIINFKGCGRTQPRPTLLLAVRKNKTLKAPPVSSTHKLATRWGWGST